MPVRPVALAFRGRCPVVGWWIDPALIGLDAARARVLDLWMPGARLWRTVHGWWLELPESRTLRGPWPAGPVVAIDGLPSTVPLTASERVALGGPGLVVAVEGVARVVRPLRELDPSEWIVLGAVRAPPVRGLRPPPPGPVPVVPIAEAGPDAFGIAVAPDRDATLAALAASDQRAPGGARGRSVRWSAAVDLLRSALTTDAAGREVARHGGSRVDPMTRALAWLDDRLARLAARWRLHGLLAERTASYLEDLLRRLDDGDLDGALQRAVPLGEGDGGDGRLTWRLPGPRDALEPSLAPRGASTTHAVGLGRFHEELRARYERAARALIRAGRVREAAFVLADLLDRPERAVRLLEEHEEWALAAELAEARGLEPAWVVRLWLLAGDLERAVVVAWRHEVFEVAIAGLAEDRPTAARALRVAWAATLVAAGRPARAVEVVWPEDDLRPAAEPWIHDAIGLGGSEGARMLARLRVLRPDDGAAHVTLAAAWLDDPAPAAAVTRAALAGALRELPVTPTNRALGRATLRALLADAGAGRPAARAIAGLREWLRDPATEADLPRLPRPALTWSHAWAGSDRGARIAHHAAVLPSGGVVVALGDTGTLVIDRGQRTLHDVPARHLVLSDSGARLLALRPVDDRWRLTRLNLVTGDVTAAGEVVLERWCAGYDGGRWFVAADGDLLAIDVLASGWRHHWRVGDVGRVVGLQRTPGALVLFTDDDLRLWGWRYALPGLVLRERRDLGSRDLDGASVLWARGTRVVPSPWPSSAAWTGGTVHVERDGDGVVVRVQGGVDGALTLGGATGARLHVDPWDRLTAVDDAGRLVAVDLPTGALLHDLRL